MTPRESVPPGERLRIVTWNIHKGIGGVDRRYALSRVVETLRHYEADIVLLQEVAQAIPRLRNEDQVALLTDALGLHAAFHPEHQFKRGGYGNLILSRTPLSNKRHVDLTVGRRKRRGLLLCETRVGEGESSQRLSVANLHLGLAGSERKAQLRRALSHPLLAALGDDQSVVLAGDLNDLWGSLGPALLVPERFERAGRLQNTFPAALPLRPLDGVFFRGRLQSVRCDVGRTALCRAASDHLPIYADFRLVSPRMGKLSK